MRETNKIIFKWVDNVKPEVAKRGKKNFYMQIQQLNYVTGILSELCQNTRNLNSRFWTQSKF